MTFFLSSIQRRDEDWPLFAFLSSSIISTDKNCSHTKKKGHASASRLSGGLLVSEFFQSEKQRSLDDQRIDEALRKIKEMFSLCLWLQSFFSFVLSFFLFTFHRRTLELKTDLATRQEKWKISRYTETCIGPTVGAVGPTVGAGWLHRSSSFRNFANFFAENEVFCTKQSLKTWLFKTPAKT